MNAGKLRVLMLATYFPKPLNHLMGNWALSQAQALQRSGVEIEVVSFTAWVPQFVAVTPGAKAYACCPPSTQWEGLRVHYPRWPVYPVGPLRRWAEPNPERFLRVGWMAAAPWLRRYIRSHRPHVIYAHHTAVNGYLAWQLHRSYGLPYVVTDHDFGEIRSCESWPARRRLFEKVAAESSRMVAVASRMEADLKRLFAAARTSTVHNGTNPIPDRYRQVSRPEEIRGKKVLFSCGSFSERKGFPLLIEAFSRVAPAYPDSILCIAGNGASFPEVQSLIQRHNLAGQVKLLGQLSHEDVLQRMLWSDAFVLVGWDEPFATVYSEAASAGLPIVCCNDGGFTDVLRNEVHGLVVPPRDAGAAAEALGRLLQNNDLRQRLGQAAKELFETRLRWDHNAQEMLSIFRSAVEDPRPAPVQIPSRE